MENKTSVILRRTYRSQLMKLCDEVKELVNKGAGREEVVAITGKIKHLKHSLSELNEKILAGVPGKNLEEECKKIAEHELAAAAALALAEDSLSTVCKNPQEPGKDRNTSGAAETADEGTKAQPPSVEGPTSSLLTNRATVSGENLVCAVCQKNSSLRCARCRRIAYCSKEHQKLDWKVHKKSCGPVASSTCFKVAKDQKVGRHLVSTRLISEGEIILEEVPLVTGPSEDTRPVCLGCYKLLSPINSRNCSRCNWPVCSLDCENSKDHKPECEITTKFKKEKVNITNFETKHPSYRCLIVLRCLYLKNTDRAAWKKVDALESHMEQRKNSERYEQDMRFVVKFIPRFFNFHEFSEEDIARMAAIVDVNSHFVPLKKSDYIAIYDKGSMFEHSCLPNCSKRFTEDGKLVIRAARKIQEGEHLSISYTYPLWGRQARQVHLLRTKYFVCECDRCSDPTELGTHFNSFKCPKVGCCGYAVPAPNSGLPIENEWQCAECCAFYPRRDFTDLAAALTLEASNVQKTNPEGCKQFLMKYKKYLHPNHYLMVSVEVELLKYFDGTDMVRVSDEDLNCIINISKHLLDLASKLTPAENVFRGFLYLRLRASLSELWRRLWLLGKLDDRQLQQHLLMRRDLLEKTYSFFEIEREVFEEKEVPFEVLEHIHLLKRVMEHAFQFY